MHKPADEAALRDLVRRTVEATPVLDIHTHLYPPGFGGLMAWGIDELLTYHYLIAELFRVAPIPC
ncbi:MAG: glucuronate isomerase, partial [Phycisphaerae bacterium]